MRAPSLAPAFHGEESMDERRRAPRRLVKKSATILLGGTRRLICAVRDVSKTGAGLDLAGDVSLPGVFKLVIEMETAQRRCRMIWRNENRMGVVFET
jgi:hypothetical protein